MYNASTRNKCRPEGLEYGLFVMVVAVSAIALLSPLGVSLTDLYGVVSSMMAQVAVS